MRRTLLLFLFFILLSLFLILFDRKGFLRPVRGSLERFIIPLESRIYGLRQEGERAGRQEGELERKIAVLEGQMATLKKENSDMRRLLGAPLPGNWQFQPAKAIGFDKGTLLLDKGLKENVVLGQAAVFENIFVGKVSSSGEHLSRLETPQSPNLKIQVVVRTLNQEGVTGRGLLTFQGGKIILDRVLPEEQIREGDWVLTAGSFGVPPDLLIGKIGKIEKKSSSLFQKAEVLPLLSYGKLENVFLVILR